MTSIRWGILGAGGIASTFVADLLGAREQGADFTVSAVGSRRAETSRAFADRFGIEHAHASYEALVSDPTVDVVYIATPHVFHRDQALLAIAAGKHVLVEKPFTINAVEAREIFDEAEAAGVIALEAMWTRFLPQNDELRRILRSGLIGEPRFFHGTHFQSLPTDPHHRINDPALGGGALLDLGVYPVSFALDVFGAPTSILASGLLSEQGVDKRVSTVFGHTGGAASTTSSALDTAGPNAGSIQGSEGRVEIDGTFFTASGLTVFDAEGEVLERYDSDEGGLRGMHHQALEMARLVEHGRSADDRLSPADTLAVMATMDEIRRQIGVRYPSETASR
ncbi:Gfo/Idh/MocA family protein [Frondihabitans cladoniiphilus]|uniref:Gfo/Idh/MocA family oxidoreductase n=1 Tax=Frondihabitans cladoniiphilus TaxID=715785 RepID=A0ABP8W268_9MICO